jgi:hypothetical protein
MNYVLGGLCDSRSYTHTQAGAGSSACASLSIRYLSPALGFGLFLVPSARTRAPAPRDIKPTSMAILRRFLPRQVPLRLCRILCMGFYGAFRSVICVTAAALAGSADTAGYFYRNANPSPK